MNQYTDKRSESKFTEKEIMMRIYDSMQDILRNQARTEEKVDGLCKIIDRQQVQIDSVNQMINRQGKVETKVDTMSQDLKKLGHRVDELEQRAGKTALAVWKKIGGIVISVIVTAFVTALVGHFMVVGK